MKNKYKTLYIIHFVRCDSCNFRIMETDTGFGLAADAISFGEDLHQAFASKNSQNVQCDKSQLTFSIRKIYVQISE